MVGLHHYSHRDDSCIINFRKEMTNTATHFTKSSPKRADITGSPEQAFNMQFKRTPYLEYILGGIAAKTIAALGSVATDGSFQYLYAPQIHKDLGGKPIGIVGTSSNKTGEFSCVYMQLSNFKLFPSVDSEASMNEFLKHTELDEIPTENLKHTDWKDKTGPFRGTLLPNFFIVYFGQEIPQGKITSDDEKTTMAKLGPGYKLWVSTVSEAIENLDDINCVIDSYNAVDVDMTLSAFYKKHFHPHYDETTSLPISGSPYGIVTTVQSDSFPVEVEAIKNVFFPAQLRLPQSMLPAASSLTLKLPGDDEKEVVAVDGLTKLALFHICGDLNSESTSFGTLNLPSYSKGMDIVVNQPRAARAGSLSELLRQTLVTARDEDPMNLRSNQVSIKHISKAVTGHILAGNFATEEATSLDNEANAIDPSIGLPQKNPALIKREVNKDLNARSESAMDVIDSQKAKTVTSIARIGSMLDMKDFTSLCVNLDTLVMGMISSEGPQPLFRHFLLVFIRTVNSRDWADWYSKHGDGMQGLHWHLYIYLERIFNLLADFAKNFNNVNVITGKRPLDDLDTRPLTKALKVLKAFIDQVDLAQSTNSPIIYSRSSFLKFQISPLNSMRCDLPGYTFSPSNTSMPGNASRSTNETQNARRVNSNNDGAKRDSAATPPNNGNSRDQARQRTKKPRRSAISDSANKRNVKEMGMFFLHKPDMKATDVFPINMVEKVCVDFSCKGRECTRESCTFIHPRKVSDMHRETINAIGDHFLAKNIGYFNEWHFLPLLNELPVKYKPLLGGKDGPSSKTD